MSIFVALIRGINVGRAKRIAMGDLRRLFEQLGHRDVRTLLNSGNVIFGSPRATPPRLAKAIENAIVERFAISASVVVISASDLDAIVAANPLQGVASNPSRHFVAFPLRPETLTRLKPLVKQAWAPDALVVGRHAAYLWCEAGALESKLSIAVTRLAGEEVTIRNWATVQKLQSAIAGSK